MFEVITQRILGPFGDFIFKAGCGTDTLGGYDSDYLFVELEVHLKMQLEGLEFLLILLVFVWQGHPKYLVDFDLRGLVHIGVAVSTNP